MITIKYVKGLPLEYESFLINRYESFFTSCRYIEVYHPDNKVNYALIYDDDELVDLLMFENRGDITVCLNVLVHIDQTIYAEFIKFIFKDFPAIKKVKIIFSYNKYVFDKSVLIVDNIDYIVRLPSKLDDYMLELGTSTRKNIRNYTSKLLRDYQNVNFITKYGSDIEQSTIDRIVQLNTARMNHKGIIPGRDNTEMLNIYKYSQYYGVVTFIEIDGVIIAGIIAYILNNRMYGHVIAHDENFSKYSIGKICHLYLIQIAIEKKVSTFHFLWGDNDFKKRFLGEPHPMASYFVYRAYSLNFLVTKGKTTLSRTWLKIRQSEFLKPIRKTVKSYRKNKLIAKT